MKRNPRLSLHEAAQSRRKRGADQRGTHLFRFLVLSILHCVVDMAQHILDRIRVRQIEWKKRHQWMVFNLFITSCETCQKVASFARDKLNVKCGLKLPSCTRIATGNGKGEKKGWEACQEFLRDLFRPCEVFAGGGHDWRNKATRTSTTFRVCSQIRDHTHVRNADKDGGIDAACVK